MKILVTGHRGFLGRHVFARLHVDHARDGLIGLDLPERDIMLDSPLVPDGVEAIVHLAAVPDVQGVDPDLTWAVNVEGTRRLLYDTPPSCRTVVLLSSACVYGHDSAEDGRQLAPVSVYGASKLACEGLCSAWAAAEPGRRWAALRSVAMYGRGYARGHVLDFVTRYQRDGKVTALDDGSQRKGGVHVIDVAGAVELLLSRGSGAYDCGSEPWGWADTAVEMGIDVERGPAKLGFVGDAERVVPLDSLRLTALGWRPTWTVAEGVREALASLGWVSP